MRNVSGQCGLEENRCSCSIWQIYVDEPRICIPRRGSGSEGSRLVKWAEADANSVVGLIIRYRYYYEYNTSCSIPSKYV